VDVVELAPEHIEELGKAKRLLERPNLAVRLTDTIGTPIEKGIRMLPAKWSETVNTAVHGALERALTVAVRSLAGRPARESKDRFHKLAVMVTGAGGGAFGLPGLAVELPVSTTMMLRSIADIARSEGEDLGSVESQLACLEVFALGGKSQADDAAETGYFAIRSALASSVTEAAKHLAQRGLTERGAPALIRFVSAIASRFGVVVSDKIAAMAVPAIGAIGGAAVNRIFIDHFQDMARGHFIVRRLERLYGASSVRTTYERLTV
jgi:hypothetical protein